MTVYRVAGSREARMQVRYNSEADVLFVVLRSAQGGEAGGRRLDDTRVARLDHSGRVFAYEFLAASRGVSLDGIGVEDAALIREAIQPVSRLAAT